MLPCYHQALVPTFPKTAANSPRIQQVWSGHNQLLIFIIHLPLANARSCSLAGGRRTMCVLPVLFLQSCSSFPTILFSLVASSPDTCLPQGTFSKFAPDTPIPQDLCTLQVHVGSGKVPHLCSSTVSHHLLDARAPSLESPLTSLCPFGLSPN